MEKKQLPNATAVMILGILSLVTCCCYGIFGLIFSGIALILANKDMKLYKENPELYSNYGNLNTGRIIAIIGLILSSIFILYLVYLIYSIGWDGIQEAANEFKRAYTEARNQNN